MAGDCALGGAILTAPASTRFGAQTRPKISGDGASEISRDRFFLGTAHEEVEHVNKRMNTTTFELPRIIPLVPVRPPRPAVPSPQASVCRDALNLELVRCARGQGDQGSGRWESREPAAQRSASR